MACKQLRGNHARNQQDSRQPAHPDGSSNPGRRFEPDGPHQRCRRCTPPVVLIHSPSISTATKYRNTTTAICHPARLCDTLPCSATNKVAAARSSGRRGVDHIRAGGRFKDQAQLTGTVTRATSPLTRRRHDRPTAERSCDLDHIRVSGQRRRYAVTVHAESWSRIGHER
jgi:hypothetical protein